MGMRIRKRLKCVLLSYDPAEIFIIEYQMRSFSNNKSLGKKKKTSGIPMMDSW